MAGAEKVLLEARVGSFDVHTTWGATAAARQLVEVGQHIEWRDGATVQTWRLPDQLPDDSLPTLARVVYAESAAVIPAGGLEVPETHVLLVSEEGRALAVVAVATVSYGGMSIVELEKVWPRVQFEDLRLRGVLVHEVKTGDVGELRKRFPGAVSRARVLSYSRRTFLTVGAALGVALVAMYLFTRG